MIQANSEEVMDRASLLIDMHLRDLRTQKQLMDRADAAAQRVSSPPLPTTSFLSCVTHSFTD